MADKGDKKVEDATIDGDEEIAAEQRFQAQCFLLRNISSDLLTNKTTKYSEFTTVRGDPSMVINALTSRMGASVLFSLTSEEMARLMPFIKVYKVKNMTASNPGEKYLFPFSMGSFVDNRFGKHNVEDIFKNLNARGADAGIESVDFEMLATNPAEVKNHMKCTLNLFFRNLSVLEQRITSKKAKGFGTESMLYSDLITRPPETKRGDDKYDPSSYVIQLVIGWNNELVSSGYSGKLVPDPDNPMGSQIDRSKAIEKALKKTQLSLNLTLKKHTFNFQPDGSVKLEIEYHAWAEGAMSSPASDLFYISGYLGTQIDQLKAAKEFRKRQLEEGIASDKESGGTNFTDDPLGPGESDKENVEEDIEAINKKITEIKKKGMGKSWQRIIDRLLAKNKGAKNVKLYALDMPLKALASGIEEIKASGKIEEEDDDDADEQLKRKYAVRYNRRRCRSIKSQKGKALKKNRRHRGELTSGERQGLFDMDVKDYLDEVFDRQINGEGMLEDDAVEEATDLLEKLTPARNKVGDEYMRVVYFYFGDLINTVLRILKESSDWKSDPASNVGVLLGPMSFSHPCMPEDIVSKNLADIPISLSLFTAWFIKKVIAKQRSTYLFRNFINDVIKELVAPALGEQCTEGLGKVDVVISSNIYSIKTDHVSATSYSPPIEKGRSITPRGLRHIVNKYSLEDPDSALVSEFPYVFLYSSAKSGAQLKCNRMQDETKLGIYHFDFGRDTGVIYKMQFERNDAPYLGEAKVTGKNNVGADLGGGAVYNVNIEMFGNSVFWPGQYIYVNPGSLDIGDASGCPDDSVPEEKKPIYHRIRLGGYYLITKVKGSLERGKYITSVTARYETTGGKPTKSPEKLPHELYTSYDKKSGNRVTDHKKKSDILAGLKLADADQYEENP